jgi:cellulose synthase/poly-beta-1,6-N-acetylglucosamine synthase-like glycosyltransferase
VYRWPASPFGLGSGFNLAFRREALRSAGDFDASLGSGAPFRSAEDTDILYRVLRTGWEVLCSDRVTVTHYDWRSVREEILVHRDYGLGAGAFTAKHVQAGDRDAWGFARREGDGHLQTLGRAMLTLRPRLALLQTMFGWLAFDAVTSVRSMALTRPLVEKARVPSHHVRRDVHERA